MTDRSKYFPHLAGSLLLATGAVMAFLGKWEPDQRDPGLVYADQLAGGLPTVCKGLTKHVTTRPLVVGQRWTVQQCAQEEGAAIEALQLRLANCFTRLPPQAVFDMATSHAWNNGVGNTCASQAMVAWNVGDWELGCERLSRSNAGKLVWSYVRTGRMLADGRPEMRFVQGLANRRADETKTCLEGLAQ
ncbi:lysozyme [Acidovorax sp. Root219]|uniref:lysozyme n=1 Tax=Acidovorax sp. Root219 TaxID=1736493 RepID=UPI00070DC975|nr:lysozyme [Acidovorax sp. Root219]KRC36224.1 lysozyme [Acidovorax sp. Root219]